MRYLVYTSHCSFFKVSQLECVKCMQRACLCFLHWYIYGDVIYWVYIWNYSLWGTILRTHLILQHLGFFFLKKPVHRRTIKKIGEIAVIYFPISLGHICLGILIFNLHENHCTCSQHSASELQGGVSRCKQSSAQEFINYWKHIQLNNTHFNCTDKSSTSKYATLIYLYGSWFLSFNYMNSAQLRAKGGN